MFAGTALSVRLLVYVGLSLFIINGPYVYMVVCVVYAYNLTVGTQYAVGVSAKRSTHTVDLANMGGGDHYL